MAKAYEKQSKLNGHEKGMNDRKQKSEKSKYYFIVSTKNVHNKTMNNSKMIKRYINEGGREWKC